MRYNTAISEAAVPASMSRLIFLADGGGLGDLVGVFGERGLRAGVALADQVQLAAGHPAAGSGDDAIGQRHHLRGGPVVALEAHHCGVGKAPREVQQILRRGAGERIDGLVGVADDGEIVAVTQPRVQHALLQRGDVLIFVDHEAAVPVAELLGDRRVVLDGGGGMQQQIVEVQQCCPVAAGLERLVPRYTVATFCASNGMSRPAAATAAA